MMPPPPVDGGQDDPDTGTAPGECMGSGEAMCTRANADSVCVGEMCLLVRCRDPYLDCDGSAANGCETTLATPQHCGACRASCVRAHVDRSLCDPDADDGPCLIDHACPVGAVDCVDGNPSNGCEPGYGDCDGNVQNGCEASLRTLIDCGVCGMACASADSEVTCATGQCVALGCAPGYGDCREQGCQSLAADPQHCGSCDNPCTEDEQCHGGRCTGLSCAPATADCDGDSENDCETDLEAVTNCGACDVSCGPYANAQAGCEEGQCIISTCDPGFGDCDRDRGNGCEVDLTEPEACGACGNDCSALPHVESAACSADGQCTGLTCEEGWADCDGNPANGCEQSLSTSEHCGGCGDACVRARATTTCGSGRCMVTECEDGFDDCNGDAADGCEVQLDSTDHCGGCGNACMSGAVCTSGGCACGSSEGCAAGTECCEGTCVNTQSACFPWPCIPGTNADEANCGGCGETCFTWCCLTF